MQSMISTTHLCSNQIQVHWFKTPQNHMTVGAVRKMDPQASQDFSSVLLDHTLIQGMQTQSMRSLSKQVRKDHGVMQVFIQPHCLGMFVQAELDQLKNQTAHLHQALFEHEVTQDEFEVLQAKMTQNLQHSGQVAHARMRLMQSFSLYEAFEPYQNQQSDLVLDAGTLDFDQYLAHKKQMHHWPLTFFLVGGDQKAFTELCDILEQSDDVALEPSYVCKVNTPCIIRSLTDDPQASHYMGFQTTLTDDESKLYFDFMQNYLGQRFATQGIGVKDLHVGSQSILGFEKDLSITQIPDHMENLWKTLLALREKTPSKEDFDQALVTAKTNLSQTLQTSQSILAYLMKNTGGTSYFDFVERYQNVDVSRWMHFQESMLCFDRQWILEVVPQIYGMGASSDLRLESLKKRVGYTEPTKKHLADQYQFEPLSIYPKQTGPNHYAQSVFINAQHTLVQNKLSGQNLTHLTLYFEGGRRFEHEKNAGMTQLLCMSVLYGSHEKRNIVSQLKQYGVTIDIENTADFFGFHFCMHPTLVNQFLSQIIRLVYETDFDESFVNEQKIQLLKEQTLKNQDAFFRSVELFYRSLFGIHGYGQARLGSPSSVLNLQVPDLIDAFHQSVLGAKTLWVVTSSTQHDDIAVLLSKQVPSKEDVGQDTAQLFALVPKRSIQIMQDAQVEPVQSVCMGLKTIGVKDPRQYFLDILQIYLSGSGGKLSDALIDKLQLVDTVKAYHVHLQQAGAFFIQLRSNQTQDGSLFEYLQTIFTSLTTVLPSQELFENAKRLAVLRQKQRLQEARELSYDIASQHFAGQQWEDPRVVEQNITKTTPSEMTHMLSDLMDYHSFAMGVC